MFFNTVYAHYYADREKCGKINCYYYRVEKV